MGTHSHHRPHERPGKGNRERYPPPLMYRYIGAAAVAGLGSLVMAVLGGTMFAAFENLLDSGG